MGLKGWIIPQERQFFDLLEKLAATVDEGAAPWWICCTTSATCR